MRIFDDKNVCCGCGVCTLLCPTKCIDMTEDEEGFSYPAINQDVCNECGFCRENCAFQNEKPPVERLGLPHIYAAKHKNDDIRMASTSGGAFTALSDWILSSGGVVFGVKFNDNFTAVTTYATTSGERDTFRGSKYIQSELGNSFIEAKEFLKMGKPVMFSGTPCQIAALRGYCRDVNIDNLYLCDFICHGVPPQKLFKDCVGYMEKSIGKRIVKYHHRYKSPKVKWSHMEAQIDENGRYYYYYYYRHIFYSNNALRPCCYNCKYASFTRKADITIADFWGIKKCMPDFYDRMGVSLILINSGKGSIWFDGAREDFLLRESNREDCSRGNPHLIRAVEMPVTRERFWEDYRNREFSYIIKKYGGKQFVIRCKKIVANVLDDIGLLEFALRVLAIWRRIVGFMP